MSTKISNANAGVFGFLREPFGNCLRPFPIERTICQNNANQDRESVVTTSKNNQLEVVEMMDNLCSSFPTSICPFQRIGTSQYYP